MGEIEKNILYIKNNYGKICLEEAVGGERSLSEFLDLLAADSSNACESKYENVGLKIHMRGKRNDVSKH